MYDELIAKIRQLDSSMIIKTSAKEGIGLLVTIYNIPNDKFYDLRNQVDKLLKDFTLDNGISIALKAVNVDMTVERYPEVLKDV